VKKLAILGASGHGRVAADIAEQQGWEKIELFDAAWPNIQTSEHDFVIAGDETSFWENLNQYDAAFIALGDNVIRKEKYDQLMTTDIELINLISNSAIISNRVQLGHGILVAELACIKTGSIIADGVIINTNATIDHDCQIDSFVHLSPAVSLAGNVSVATMSWLGIGSCVIQNIRIGTEVIAGAGSVITNDIPDNVTVVGVPATVIKENN